MDTDLVNVQFSDSISEGFALHVQEELEFYQH
jgi:hypothetical protein